LPPLQAIFASVVLLLAPPMSAQPVMKSAAAEAATAKPNIFLRSMIRSPSNVIDDLPGYGPSVPAASGSTQRPGNWM